MASKGRMLNSLERIAMWARLKALCFDLVADLHGFSADDDYRRLFHERTPAPGRQKKAAQFADDPNTFG